MLEKAVFFAEYETVNSTGTSGIKYYPHIKKIIPWCHYISNYVSPCDRGKTRIVFGSVVCVIVYVSPCECNNFLIILNFTFKLEPCINHIKVSEEFKNW